MIDPSIDKILTKVGSKYKLVYIVSKRSREMDKTGYYPIPQEKYKSKRNIGRALEEIYEDLIREK